MSKPKWTPAPWRFHQPWSGFSKITGPSGELIFGIAAGSVDEKRPDDECEANARLIAAAPDLYEALSWQLAQTIRLSIGVPQEDIDSDAIIFQSRAALAKARGETP